MYVHMHVCMYSTLYMWCLPVKVFPIVFLAGIWGISAIGGVATWSPDVGGMLGQCGVKDLAWAHLPACLEPDLRGRTFPFPTAYLSSLAGAPALKIRLTREKHNTYIECTFHVTREPS